MDPKSEIVRRYVALPDRNWSKEYVLKLLKEDPVEFFENLLSIMQMQETTDDWKVQLVTSLLATKVDEQLCCRLWDALSIRARIESSECFADAAEKAWKLIDSHEQESSIPELEAVQHFLEDVRVCLFSPASDLIQIKSWALLNIRFRQFAGIRALSAYGAISEAGQQLIVLAGSGDFVLRESVANAVSIIYSREDCEPATLGPMKCVFSQLVVQAENDSHWYVRKAGKTARFFHEQYHMEF